MTRSRLRHAALVVAAAATLVACGSEKLDLPDGASARLQEGGLIFNDKCSGCHTLEIAGTQGSAVDVRDRERVDGPNFNTRQETVDAVLYAIRNGGFSGAIMPENIVVGDDARKVAEFLAKYSGNPTAAKPQAPQSPQPGDG